MDETSATTAAAWKRTTPAPCGMKHHVEQPLFMLDPENLPQHCHITISQVSTQLHFGFKPFLNALRTSAPGTWRFKAIGSISSYKKRGQAVWDAFKGFGEILYHGTASTTMELLITS
ncbi:hypothetical protein PCANC_06081 [Puccinia coronata f. sp. avenae]|uniref:Uncharacterized protein n=1 Tax=Puccinia coronata f. sp. avenae TaxID=200324 RepID=A0A2N5VTS4_9BASI|nr:hypothetical protein PCANC_06081 [Puccinia coronata f. sp. avenae]